VKPPESGELALAWWVDRILLPILFLLVGALIGFAGTWIRDRLEARDAKRAFLRAIRRELEALDRQLVGAGMEVEGALQRPEESRHLPRFALRFQTSVYSTQLGKLKDVDDSLVLAIIEVYSDISSLYGIVELLNQQSAEAAVLPVPVSGTIFEQVRGAEPHLRAVARTRSTCRVLLEQLRSLQPRVHALLAKLPQ
jgi:hypothetical protein